MKKFQFRFSSVLKVRKIREQEALKSLAKTKLIYQKELENKKNILKDLNLAYERKNNLDKKIIPLAVLLTEQDYIEGLNQKIIKSDYSIFKANRMVSKALKNYIFVRAECQRIQLLYENSLSEFKKSQCKIDEKELDNLIHSRIQYCGDFL